LNDESQSVAVATSPAHGDEAIAVAVQPGTGYTSGAGATVMLWNNEPPVAAADGPYTVAPSGDLVIDPDGGVLANDTDPNGDPFTAVAAAGPAHGTLTLNPDGSFEYVPADDFTGANTITYTAVDQWRAGPFMMSARHSLRAEPFGLFFALGQPPVPVGFQSGEFLRLA
jgi:hypothetical protein